MKPRLRIAARSSRLLLLVPILAVAAGCSNPKLGASDSCSTDEQCPGGACVQGLCKTCPACASGETCVGGECVAQATCPSACGSGAQCVNGACVPLDCAQVTCPQGQLCAHGQCFAKDCATACASGEVCINGACVAQGCAGVSCAQGKHCENGACVADSCAGQICGAGSHCAAGKCIVDACEGVVCTGGTLCANGRCEPTGCNGVPCAAGEVCLGKACVDAACVGVSCQAGSSCRAGACLLDTCQPSDQPRPCGVPGSTCVQRCAGGKFGACQPAAGAANLQTDAANCGTCGHVCPTPVNAAATCTNGVCGRGPCTQGFADLDGATTFGCEASCSGKTCTTPGGTTVTLTDPPLPERGQVFSAFASGGSFGSAVQTSRLHTNVGSLGESTPPVAGGGIETKSSTHRNLGGFTAAQH